MLAISPLGDRSLEQRKACSYQRVDSLKLSRLYAVAIRKLAKADQQLIDISSSALVWIEKGRFTGEEVRALSGFSVDRAEQECIGCLDDLMTSLDVSYFSNNGARALIGQRAYQKNEYGWHER